MLPSRRKIYVIDVVRAAWVPRVFHWFVDRRRSLRWITGELNRLGAEGSSLDDPRMAHAYVTRLLRNRKYIGDWSWGERRNVRNPLTGKIRQENRSPEETEQWRRSFPI